MQRQVDADAGRQVARPHAAADHDVVGFDIAAGGRNAGDLVAVVLDRGDFGVLEYLCAAIARAFRQRLADIDRVGVAVGWNVDAAEQVAAVDQRVALLDFVGANDVDFEVEHFGHRRAALEFFKAFVVGGDRYRSALPVAGRLAGFVFESAVELTRVLRELGHVDGRAQLADESGRVPGRAAGQLLAFEQTTSLQPIFAR